METLDPDESATATITGTPEDPVLNLGIPKGESGGGDAGDITFDPEEDYDEDTVGKALKDELNAISQKAPVIINTASGDIATFSDGADGRPIKHLVANIEAVQSGTGDPSPSNIRPITGWTGLTCVRNGINQWDEQWENGYYYKNSSDKIAKGSSQTTIRSKNPIPIKQNTSYSVVGAVYKYFFTDADGNVLVDGSGRNIIAPDGACYLYFYCENVSTYNNNISINYPGTDTDYHSGTDNQTISVSWATKAGTVYDGTVDVVTGELTVTDAMVDLGTMEWTYNSSQDRFIATLLGSIVSINNNTPANIICSQYKTVSTNDNINIDKTCGLSIYNTLGVKDTSYGADATAFTTAMSGVKLVYELATPQTYQLDPVTVSTLLGNNTVYVDCGSVSVDYPADTGIVVAEQSNAISQLEDQVVTDVTVSGTIVTITAEANKRYLCGTVSSIDVTPCVSGAFDLIFTSGSTAAVLTIPNTVKWQDSSFDPTALDTDTIYEISVADGVLGLVASWT